MVRSVILDLLFPAQNSEKIIQVVSELTVIIFIDYFYSYYKRYKNIQNKRCSSFKGGLEEQDLF